MRGKGPDSKKEGRLGEGESPDSSIKTRRKNIGAPRDFRDTKVHEN